MYAVLSDIHANLAAFRAVLADIAAQGIERILCLGDVVGYGPDPEACLTLARDRCAVILQGNHDIAAIHEPLGFNQAARAAALWTRRQIAPGWFASRTKRRNWDTLSKAPLRHTEGPYLFVHGSPRDPAMEYIEESDVMDMGFGAGDKIEDIFSRIPSLCFVGHTHRPGVISAEYDFFRPEKIDMTWTRLSERAVVNVGAVGQPRDGDPRACYVIVDASSIRYRRIAYDVEETIRKIRAIPELDNLLGDRLADGR